MSVKIADVIVPDVFNPYVVERTAELTALYLGGIVSTNPELNRLAEAGGKLIQMPFWGDLDGDDELLSDSGALTPGKITAGKDQSRLHMRGRAWGVNDLSKALSGDDPARAIADGVAEYWFRRRQALLFSSLKGVFADNAANDSSDMIHDVAIETGDTATAAEKIGPNTVIASAGTMGDAAQRIRAISVHSTLMQELQRQEVITYVQPAGVDIQLPTYLGKRVIEDDGHPVVAAATNGFKYTSFLFGEGAIGVADGAAPTPSETDRDSLAGEDYLITRAHYLLHPRGVAWQESSVAAETPSNAECEAAANWNRVYERKNVRVAQLVTNG